MLAQHGDGLCEAVKKKIGNRSSKKWMTSKQQFTNSLVDPKLIKLYYKASSISSYFCAMLFHGLQGQAVQFLTIHLSRSAVVLLLRVCWRAAMLTEKSSLEKNQLNHEQHCRTARPRVSFVTTYQHEHEWLTAEALPPICIARSWSQLQLVSSWVERMKVRCTPRDLCTAEQSIQRKTP